MAEHKATLPDLGDDAGDLARVSFFYYDEGETVEKDQPLVQMVTDKATFDVPTPVSGTLTSIEADEDENVEVGGLLAVIETPD